MRYQLEESSYILATFPTGRSPTISIYKLSDNSVVVNSAAMSEVGTTGVYKYLQQLSPAVRTEYLWMATDSYDIQSGKIVLGGYPDTLAGLQGDIAADIGAIETNIGTIQTDIAIIKAATGLHPGSIPWDYTLTDSITGLPIADAEVWASSDLAGSNILDSRRTNQAGVATLYLDAGTVYIWRSKSGFVFTNPDIEVVS